MVQLLGLILYRFLEPNAPWSERLPFFFFFFADLVGRLILFLGNKRNKRLIVSRSWERRKKGERRVCSPFPPFIVSWLSPGWTEAGFFFSTSVDMCFPSDRAAWHLTLASSHELSHVRPINREEKTRSCTQTLLLLKYFWSLVWLGLHICQIWFTPVLASVCCISLLPQSRCGQKG